MMTRKVLRSAAAAACLFTLGLSLAPTTQGAQAADVKRFMEMCEGNRMCPWFLADVAAPAGFKEDKNFGESRKLVALFPDKPKLSANDPMIYVRTTYNGDNRSLDTQASNSNTRWKESAGHTDVERLADIPRADGKGAWQVFRYFNHDRPQQAHELLAFGEHVEKGDQKFFYMVVVSSAQRRSVDGAEKSWREILAAL